MYEDALAFAKDLAREAGPIMLEHFNCETIATALKEDNSPVTIADTAINNLVIQRVQEVYPEHAVLGEEESHHQESEYLWVCDPIDGTFPYSHGMPISTFNIALVHNGIVQVSVVLDPFCSRLFSAVRGGGAYLNDVRLPDVNTRELKGWLPINVEIWGGQTSSVFSDISAQADLWAVLDKGDVMPLYLCSVAYSAALIASGDVAGALFAGRNPWDIAAASLIVEEAGGVVTDIDGQPIPSFAKDINGAMIGTKAVHEELLSRCGPTIKGLRRI